MMVGLLKLSIFLIFTKNVFFFCTFLYIFLVTFYLRESRNVEISMIVRVTNRVTRGY